MSEMIERVARALSEANGGDPGPDRWHLWVDDARAAIEAMREPTPDILNAGAFYHINHAGAAGEHELSMARQTWQAMIKKALQDDQQPA